MPSASLLATHTSRTSSAPRNFAAQRTRGFQYSCVTSHAIFVMRTSRNA